MSSFRRLNWIVILLYVCLSDFRITHQHFKDMSLSLTISQIKIVFDLHSFISACHCHLSLVTRYFMILKCFLTALPQVESSSSDPLCNDFSQMLDNNGLALLSLSTLVHTSMQRIFFMLFSRGGWLNAEVHGTGTNVTTYYKLSDRFTYVTFEVEGSVIDLNVASGNDKWNQEAHFIMKAFHTRNNPIFLLSLKVLSLDNQADNQKLLNQ